MVIFIIIFLFPFLSHFNLIDSPSHAHILTIPTIPTSYTNPLTFIPCTISLHTSLHHHPHHHHHISEFFSFSFSHTINQRKISGRWLNICHHRHLLCSYPPRPHINCIPSSAPPSSQPSCIYRCSDLYFIPISKQHSRKAGIGVYFYRFGKRLAYGFVWFSVYA